MAPRPLHERLLQEALERNSNAAGASRDAPDVDMDAEDQSPQSPVAWERDAADESDDIMVIVDDFREGDYRVFDADGNELFYAPPPYGEEEEEAAADTFQDNGEFNDENEMDVGSYVDIREEPHNLDQEPHQQWMMEEWGVEVYGEYADEGEEAAIESRREYDEYLLERQSEKINTDEHNGKSLDQKRMKHERAEKWTEIRTRQLEKKEGERVEKRLDMAEKEEQEALKELQTQKAQLRQMEQQQSGARIVQLEMEAESEAAIARLKADLQMHEQRLHGFRNKRAEQERALLNQQNAVAHARDNARAKREERRKAAIDCDEHASSLAIRYMRCCAICQTQNPRRRAALVACGHITCVTCAEKLLEDSITDDFSCPYCRKTTTFVKLFEDRDDVAQIPEPPAVKPEASQSSLEMRQQQPTTSETKETRKRYIVRSSSSSSSSNAASTGRKRFVLANSRLLPRPEA